MAMRTISIEVDGELLSEAARYTKIKKDDQVIEHALSELVKQHRRKKLDSIRKEEMWDEEEGTRRRRR